MVELGHYGHKNRGDHVVIFTLGTELLWWAEADELNVTRVALEMPTC